MEERRKAYLAFVAVALLMTVMSVSYGTIAVQSTSSQASLLPIQSNSSVASTVIIPTTHGYNVSNITLINPFTINMNGSIFRVSLAQTTQTSAEISLNGSIILLNKNIPTLIRKTSRYRFYANVSNTIYITKSLQTANIQFFSVAHAPSPFMNSTYRLSPNTPLVVNVTGTNTQISMKSAANASATLAVSNATNPSGAPPGFRPITQFNITVSSNQIVNSSVSMKYPCSIQYSTVMPYVLENNGTWVALSNYSNNRLTCMLSYALQEGLVAGIFAPAKNATTASTSSIVSTVITTTIPSIPKISGIRPSIQGGHGTSAIFAVMIVILVIVLAWYLLSKRKPKHSKGTERRIEQRMKEKDSEALKP